MNAGTISPQQLKSVVEDKWQRDEEAPAVGLHVTTDWRGPSEVVFDKWTAAVVRADTVFQVRAALRSAQVLGMPAVAILGARVGPEVPLELTPAGRLTAPEATQIRPDAEAILGAAIPLQLLAERLARARGRNPDPIGRDDPRQAAAADA